MFLADHVARYNHKDDEGNKKGVRLRVALVHDWFLGLRGGEKVLDALAQLYPDAELFTLLADSRVMTPTLAKMKLHTSWLQKLPGVKGYYRKLLPWMPGAIEQFDLHGFDLVISSSHCVSKGVKVPEGVPHVCYCHTPMRYAWHMREIYLEGIPKLLRPWARSVLDKLRDWDCATAQKVTQFVSNGRTVQQRIKEDYGLESVIVHPPVDTGFYVLDERVEREDYYLIVSALAPNKRVDLAIAACQQLGRKLVVIGSGEQSIKLRKMAGAETTFLGWCSDEVIREHYQRCQALLFPGVEDFGIVPIEAQACGAAVIAYGEGGATETVVPMEQERPTGIWFETASAQALADAIKLYEASKVRVQAKDCRENAMLYGKEQFLLNMKDVLMPHLPR